MSTQLTTTHPTRLALLFLAALTLPFLDGCRGRDGTSASVTVQTVPAGAECPDGGTRIVTAVGSSPGSMAYVCNGKGGSAATVEVTPEPAGENCPTGGQRVTSTSGGGTVTAFVCNGDSAAAPIAVAEPSGANCPAGGVKLTTGDTVTFVCDGASVTVRPEEHGSNCASGGVRLESAGGTTFLCEGASAKVSVTDEPPGPNCAAGGHRLEVSDANGASTTFVCDGAPGMAAQVSVTPEPPGLNCPAGGQRIETSIGGGGVTTSYVCDGRDGRAGNDLLAVAEPPGANCANGGIKVTGSGGDQYVCNGSNGADGSDGTNGTDGTNGVDGRSVTVETEAPGAHCTYGGVRLTSVSGVSYVCNGPTGQLLQVDAGPSLVGSEADTAITLRGRATGASSVKWIQLGGPAVALSTPSALETSFVPPEVAADTILSFRLVATNGTVSESADTTVRVNRAFVVDAGQDGIANVGSTVKLQGKAWAGATRFHHWNQVAGPAVTLSDAGALNPSFEVPPGTGHPLIVLRFIASDGTRTRWDDVTFFVNNPPTNLTPPIRTVQVGHTLAAFPPVDLDGDPLTITSVGSPLPSWASLASDGSIAGTPTSADIGTSPGGHQLSVTDGFSDPVLSEPFALRVHATAFGPLITVGGDDAAAVADFDLDGRVDLVTGLSGSSLRVWRNVTDPWSTSPSFVDTLVPAPADRGFPVVADVNHDGRPDLINFYWASQDHPPQPGWLSVSLNTTTPGSPISFAGYVTVGTFGIGRDIEISDINNDGRIDIVVANYSDDVRLFMNDTLPGQASPAFHPVDVPIHTRGDSLAVTDLNRDGLPDLAISVFDEVQYWMNLGPPGSSTPEFALAGRVGGTYAIRDLQTSDMNADGLPDLLAMYTLDDARLTTGVSAWMNTGASPPQALFGSDTSAISTYYAYIGRPAPVDLNGDGRPDLGLESTVSTETPMIFNITPPGGTRAAFDTQGSVGRFGAVAADFNNDGLPDLVSRNGVRVNTSNLGASPTPKFQAATVLRPARDSSAVLATDLDRDGKPDLVFDLSSAAFNTTVPGDAHPTFAVVDRQVPYGSTLTPGEISTANLNLDGQRDLVLLDTKGYPVLAENRVTPGVRDIGFSPRYAPGFPGSSLVLVADLDGDGRPDLASATTSRILLQHNWSTQNGPPSFDSGGVGGSIAVNVSGTSAIAADDVNADGRTDVVALTPAGVSVLMNQTPVGGDHLAFVASSGAAFTGATALAVADLDGDGRPDVVAAGSGGLLVALNRTPAGSTSATYAAPTVFGTALTSPYLALGDVNGDGRVDVAATSSDTTGILVFVNATSSSTVSFRTPVTVSTQAVPGSVALVDMNLDGRLDLVARQRGGPVYEVLVNILP